MKSLVIALVLMSPFAEAALGMKPGLWTLNMRIKSEGKDISPIGKAGPKMVAMPPAEMQKVLMTIGKTDAAIGPNGETLVCYSKKILDKPENIGKPDPKCETTLIKNTTNMVATSFKCQDGTTGDSSWNLKSPDNLMGLVNYRDPQGKTSQVAYDGKFMQDNCGKVKPVL
jgi:hypothetical protein